MTEVVLLDHAATAPLRPAVREAMLPWLGPAANPSSQHRLGRAAAAAVERARSQVAALVGADPRGVVLTSGATEANHLALRGLISEGAVGVGAVEHPCVLAAARALASSGRRVVVWPADRHGRVEIGAEELALVSLQAVNHETGVVQPWAQVRRAFPGAVVHVDAVQALLTREVHVGDAVDALTVSAHKLGGPAGVGALVMRPGVALTPQWPGAQERGRRAGTPSVASIVGFGVACEEVGAQRAALAARAPKWQARIDAAVRAAGGRVVGAQSERVGTHTLGVFDGLPGEAITAALDLEGIAVSVGAACASGSQEPSPVLTAMGDPSPSSGVRCTTGWSTTDADVRALERAIGPVVARIRDVFLEEG